MTRKVDGAFGFDHQNKRNHEHTSTPFDVIAPPKTDHSNTHLFNPAGARDDLGILNGNKVLLAENKKVKDPSKSEAGRNHLASKEILELEVRLNAENDPAKKLTLWRQYQTAIVENGVDQLQPNKNKPDFKGKLERSSKQEIDEECGQIQKQIDSGSPEAVKNIAELYERKKLEFQLEQKYQVELTNETDYTSISDPKREPSKRTIWNKKELEVLDQTLMRLPIQDIKDNPKVQEIKRCVKSQNWNSSKKTWEEKEDVAGDHLNDKIRIYDNGVNKGLRDTLTHEVGHAVYDRLGESVQGRRLIRQYEDAIEWKEFSDKEAVKKSMRETTRRQLQDEGRNDKEIERILDEKTDQNFDSLEEQRHQGGGLVSPKFSIGDTRYKHDPYGTKKYYSYNNEIMPQSGAFDYASATPGEYFAEHYRMEHNVPEIANLYMNNAPRQEIIEAQNRIKSATTDADKKSAQKQLNAAQKKFDALSLQQKIMRDQVLHPEQIEGSSNEQAINELYPHYSA